MSDIVTKLEQEHKTILAHLEAIRSANYRKDVAAKELKQAKALILAHLQMEDREVYARLSKVPSAAATAEQFKAKMGPIGAEVLAFFQKYDLDAAADLGLDFARDLGGLIQKLRTRIRQEEDQLYPLVRQAAQTV